MQTVKDFTAQRKGKITLSISQDILDRIEPIRNEVNFSAEAERHFAEIASRIERQKWVERNSEALIAHGKCIAETGLAGQDFDRI